MAGGERLFHQLTASAARGPKNGKLHRCLLITLHNEELGEYLQVLNRGKLQ